MKAEARPIWPAAPSGSTSAGINGAFVSSALLGFLWVSALSARLFAEGDLDSAAPRTPSRPPEPR